MEIDEPIGGFLWNLAAKKGIWFRDYGGDGEMDRKDGLSRSLIFVQT